MGESSDEMVGAQAGEGRSDRGGVKRKRRAGVRGGSEDDGSVDGEDMEVNDLL